MEFSRTHPCTPSSLRSTLRLEDPRQLCPFVQVSVTGATGATGDDQKQKAIIRGWSDGWIDPWISG